MARLLVIDNYDSFTYNLVQLFRRFSLMIDVHRHDGIKIADIRSDLPDYILISPGPKDPDSSGISMPIINEFYREIPILGVCLGMQCINQVFGGRTVQAPLPVHGKTSRIEHDQRGLFHAVPSPFTVCRYHSLMVELPAKKRDDSHLRVTAKSSDGVIMGLSHQKYPLFGVQFHPESFLTEYGEKIAANFLQSRNWVANRE